MNKISKCNLIDNNLNIRVDKSTTKINVNKNKLTITINTTITNYNNKNNKTDFIKTLKSYLEDFLDSNDTSYFLDLIKKYDYVFYKKNKSINLDFSIKINVKFNKETV